MIKDHQNSNNLLLKQETYLGVCALDEDYYNQRLKKKKPMRTVVKVAAFVGSNTILLRLVGHGFAYFTA